MHMHARMYASPYGSKMYNTYQFDPQLWGGTLSEPKNGLGVVSIVFVFCSESNRRKTEV